MSLADIRKQIELYEAEEGVDLSIEKRNIEKIKHIISDFETQQLLTNINNPNYINKINYADVVELNDKLALMKEVVQTAKEEIDIDEFYKRGEVVDFKKLRKDFKANNLKERFPNFDIDKYEEIVKKPPLTLRNFQNQEIVYDKFIVRKLLLGINQMIFSEMDLYIANSGQEGCLAGDTLVQI